MAAALAIAIVSLGLLTRSDGGVAVVFADAPTGVVADADLRARPWGTALELRVEGLPPARTYRVWLEEDDGDRVPAGTFLGAERPLVVGLAAAAPLDGVLAVGVSDEAGDTVLYGEL